jgi:excisionase family DNA binding protein
MSEHEELLDISEAAAFLNVSETSLRRWTNSGALRHLRVGRRRERRFRRDDLLAFMEHGSERSDARSARPVAPDERQNVVVDGAMMPHGAHHCGLYSSDSGRASLAARFFAGGLRAGSACLLVASERIREGILAELESSEGSLERHIRSGTLIVCDYGKSIAEQLECCEAQLRAAQERGARTMRVVGDVTDFGTRLGRDAAEYEDDYSLRISAVFPVITLCLYDVRKFSGREIFRVLKGHPHSTREPMERWLA